MLSEAPDRQSKGLPKAIFGGLCLLGGGRAIAVLGFFWAWGCMANAPAESCLYVPELCPEGTYCDPLSQRCVDESLRRIERCEVSAGGTDCPDSARPLCLGGRCVPCTSFTTELADAACQRIGQAEGQPTLRTCIRDGVRKGQCGECRPSIAGENAVLCQTAERPVCEQGQCRPCERHSECSASSLCNDGSGLVDIPGVRVGQCAPANQVLFVDAAHCPPDGTGAEGTQERPYCEIDAALRATGGHGGYLVLRPPPTRTNVYAPLTLADGQRTVLIGAGREGWPVLSALHASGAHTQVYLVDVSLDSHGSSAVLSCSRGARLGLYRGRLHANKQATLGVDADGCERLELSESYILQSLGPAIRIGPGTRSYRLVNLLITGSATAGPSAITIAKGASGVFAFNTILNNGPTGDLAADGGAVTCEAGGQPLLSDSLIVQNGSRQGANESGHPLGTQFAGPCRLSRVVVGADAIAATAGPQAAIAAIPDLDSKLRLLDTPNNQTCCVDKAGPCDDLKTDYFGQTRPQGRACDIGAHELR